MSATVGNLFLGKRHPGYPRDSRGQPWWAWGRGGRVRSLSALSKRHPKYPKDPYGKGRVKRLGLLPHEWIDFGISRAGQVWEMYQRSQRDDGPVYVLPQPVPGPAQVVTPTRTINPTALTAGLAVAGLLLVGLAGGRRRR